MTNKSKTNSTSPKRSALPSEIKTFTDPADSSLFGEVISVYSRKDALADGIQIDVTSVAKEAGIRFPVYITHSVYSRFVKVLEGVDGQDEDGRLWDVLYMLRVAILKAAKDSSRISCQLFVRNDNKRARLVELVAECGANDFDDPAPCLTIMLPDEG